MIKIERFSEDQLTKKVWSFLLLSSHSDQITLRLDSYQEESRPSRQHRFRAKHDTKYDRSMGSRSTVSVDEVPLPQDVKTEAMALIMTSVVVTK